MLQTAPIEPNAEPAVPTAGPLYPGRCLECPELLAETYGCHAKLRCVDCVAADRAGAAARRPLS